jgi:hypothetical protein
MGEAKRRQQAGTSWQNAGPVEDFRVPTGKLAITIEVREENPSTLMFDASNVADLMHAIEQMPDRPAYGTLVRCLAAEFVKNRHSNTDVSGTGIGILWTALHHPQHGLAMRQAVSRDLRDKGKAHIIWHLTHKGLAIALAAQFVDLDTILAATPANQTVLVGRLPDADPVKN